MAATKTIYPCGFLSKSGHFTTCVRGNIDQNDANNNVIDYEDVYGYSELIKLVDNDQSKELKVLNNDALTDKVLLPHDLYDEIDYSIKKLPKDCPTNEDLYATVLPKCKRTPASKASNVDISKHVDNDISDNLDGEMPRETRFMRREPLIESDTEPKYVSMKPLARNDNKDNDGHTSHRQSWAEQTLNSRNPASIQDSECKLSSITEASNPNCTLPDFKKCEIDLQIRKKLRKEFAILQSVRKSKIFASPKSKDGPKDVKKFQLPPVCGKSPPCFCPEDQLYAAKLRIRILKKISTLRRRHIKLRVMAKHNWSF